MDQNGSVSTSPQPSSGARISPTVLIIIVVLAFLFFISGVLHLLVKFLAKRRSHPRAFHDNDVSESDALQRQLQQLFHLHDCGLDQAAIDALPVFLYKDVTGAHEPYDCAVCLSEFLLDDKLRLLPMCSHAFHIHCIDTWLLSSSTCPVCRNSLFAPGFSIENPIFEFADEDGPERSCSGRKALEIDQPAADDQELPVRLGKFRKLNDQAPSLASGLGETSGSDFGRRCYSMGSYQYVVGEPGLRVALPQGGLARTSSGRISLAGTAADSSSSFEDAEGKKICNAGKGESLSVSKIWMWPKANRLGSSSDLEMGVALPSLLNSDAPWMVRR
uniref:RING-type E3 ubiquitin transferase n=1 Tax=Kalanchoe fedtschenkoi TaxID=63787 RepID=A0A7N0T295_KALFE